VELTGSLILTAMQQISVRVASLKAGTW